jgi:hypothetical protein
MQEQTRGDTHGTYIALILLLLLLLLLLANRGGRGKGGSDLSPVLVEELPVSVPASPEAADTLAAASLASRRRARFANAMAEVLTLVTPRSAARLQGEKRMRSNQRNENKRSQHPTVPR